MGIMRETPKLVSGLKSMISNLPKDIVIAEIGCYEGESTKLFLDSGKISEMYCIDAWTAGYDDSDGASHRDLSVVEAVFDKVIMDKYDNVTKCKGWSTDIVDTFEDEFFDVVYVDGNHQYEAVLEDIKRYLPKIKPNGIICGHDYYSNKDRQPKKAVDESFGKPDKTFEDSSWLVFLENRNK